MKKSREMGERQGGEESKEDGQREEEEEKKRRASRESVDGGQRLIRGSRLGRGEGWRRRMKDEEEVGKEAGENGKWKRRKKGNMKSEQRKKWWQPST